MKRRGFSLIELLVVVGVVALIAAILFPVFSRSRDNKSGCMTNLKQLGVGFTQYMMDYNERMPLVVSNSLYALDNPATSANETSFYGWADALFPYAKSAHIYHCPTLKHSNPIANTITPLTRDCTDYWLNGRIAGLKLTDIKAPATTLVFGDGNDGSDMTDGRYNYLALPAPWLKDKKSPIFRHLEMAAYCFVDGHVKYARPIVISAGYHKGKFHFAPK